MCAIFQQKQPSVPRHLPNRQHIAGRTAHVDHDDAAGAGRDPARYIFGIETECVVNVGKDGDGALVHHRCCHRDPQVRGDDDFLAGPDTKRRQGHAQCSGPAADGKSVRRAGVLRHLRLQALGLSLQIQPVVAKQRPRFHHAHDGIHLGLVHVVHAGKLERQRR